MPIVLLAILGMGFLGGAAGVAEMVQNQLLHANQQLQTLSIPNNASISYNVPLTPVRSLQLSTFFFVTPTPYIPTPAVQAALSPDCGYTNTHSESEVLAGFSPQIAHAGDTIKVWYDDEHNLTLGKSQNGYAISPMTKFPADHLANPSIGDPAATDGRGAVVYPALFVTDITTDPTSKSGDWEVAGNAGAIPLHGIYGAWKSLGGNDTGNNVDVSTHVWNLDGGDTPSNPAAPACEGHNCYGAEAIWNVDQLVSSGKLQIGHAYRVQFVVHDGDGGNGDEGEACATVSL